MGNARRKGERGGEFVNPSFSIVAVTIAAAVSARPREESPLTLPASAGIHAAEAAVDLGESWTKEVGPEG